MNLRFSVDALRMVIEFKMASDYFPSKELMNIFSDLLPVSDISCVSTFLSEESYEYFYSGKSTPVPSKEEHRRWVISWGKSVSVRKLKIETTRRNKKGLASYENTEKSTELAYFIVIDSEEIQKNSNLYKARKRLIEEIKDIEKKNHPEIKRVRMSISEDILKYSPKEETASISKKTDKPQAQAQIQNKTDKPQAQAQNNLLSFITKKYSVNEEVSSRILIRPAGIFHGPIQTVRHCKEIAKPIRMLFYQLHGQIRPPFYGIKTCRDTSKIKVQSKDSTKKILPSEEYLYDSDEEWIEGDGESIEEESEESIEEGSEETEWVEEDTNEIFFSKGQLPRIDHPPFTVLVVDETGTE